MYKRSKRRMDQVFRTRLKIRDMQPCRTTSDMQDVKNSARKGRTRCSGLELKDPGPGRGTAATATVLQMAVGQNRYRDAKNRESCRGRGAFLPISPSQSSVCRFEIDACKAAAN